MLQTGIIQNRNVEVPKSISDDDLCANCKNCQYIPGGNSRCTLGWPGIEDDDGYILECNSFKIQQ